MESENIKSENEKALRTLAEQMFINHIRSSIIFEYDTNDINKIGKHVNICKGKRVIFVVGAAASYEAGVPSSDKAVEILKNKLNIDAQRFDKDIERLSTVYRLWPNDFETQLLAFSYQSGFELRNQLGDPFLWVT